MKNAPTIKDVANAAGVSIATVSRVLNSTVPVTSSLKEKVERAVAETGYQSNPIAGNMKSMRRNQIAMIIPTLRQNYYTDIIKGISDYCYEQDAVPIVLESNGDLEREMKLIKSLEKQWVDGIILVSGIRNEDDEYSLYLQRLAKLNKRHTSIPVILMESTVDVPGIDTLYADYEDSFSTMTEHLLEIGRKNTAYLGNSADVPMYDSFIGGISKALEKNGLAFRPEALKTDNYTVLDGYHSAMQLLKSGISIDGLICVNDQVAAGAQCACQERGLRVPEDIAVIGFGGVALSIVTTPSITTVAVPRYKMGYSGAKMMFERLSGKRTETVHKAFKGYLAIRGSTMKSAAKNLDVMFSE